MATKKPKPKPKVAKPKDQLGESSLDNTTTGKIYFGRRTGAIIKINARKGSNGFADVNDYFTDSESEEEENVPPKQQLPPKPRGKSADLTEQLYFGRRTGALIKLNIRKNSKGFGNVEDYFPDSVIESDDCTSVDGKQKKNRSVSPALQPPEEVSLPAQGNTEDKKNDEDEADSTLENIDQVEDTPKASESSSEETDCGPKVHVIIKKSPLAAVNDAEDLSQVSVTDNITPVNKDNEEVSPNLTGTAVKHSTASREPTPQFVGSRKKLFSSPVDVNPPGTTAGAGQSTASLSGPSKASQQDVVQESEDEEIDVVGLEMEEHVIPHGTAFTLDRDTAQQAADQDHTKTTGKRKKQTNKTQIEENTLIIDVEETHSTQGTAFTQDRDTAQQAADQDHTKTTGKRKKETNKTQIEENTLIIDVEETDSTQGTAFTQDRDTAQQAADQDHTKTTGKRKKKKKKTQIQEDTLIIDVEETDSTFVTLGNNMKESKSHLIEDSPLPSEDESFEIDESIVMEGTRHKTMSPEFGTSPAAVSHEGDTRNDMRGEVSIERPKGRVGRARKATNLKKVAEKGKEETDGKPELKRRRNVTRKSGVRRITRQSKNATLNNTSLKEPGDVKRATRKSTRSKGKQADSNYVSLPDEGDAKNTVNIATAAKNKSQNHNDSKVKHTRTTIGRKRNIETDELEGCTGDTSTSVNEDNDDGEYDVDLNNTVNTTGAAKNRSQSQDDSEVKLPRTTHGRKSGREKDELEGGSGDTIICTLVDVNEDNDDGSTTADPSTVTTEDQDDEPEDENEAQQGSDLVSDDHNLDNRNVCRRTREQRSMKGKSVSGDEQDDEKDSILNSLQGKNIEDNMSTSTGKFDDGEDENDANNTVNTAAAKNRSQSQDDSEVQLTRVSRGRKSRREKDELESETGDMRNMIDVNEDNDDSPTKAYSGTETTEDQDDEPEDTTGSSRHTNRDPRGKTIMHTFISASVVLDDVGDVPKHDMEEDTVDGNTQAKSARSDTSVITNKVKKRPRGQPRGKKGDATKKVAEAADNDGEDEGKLQDDASILKKSRRKTRETNKRRSKEDVDDAADDVGDHDLEYLADQSQLTGVGEVTKDHSHPQSVVGEDSASCGGERTDCSYIEVGDDGDDVCGNTEKVHQDNSEESADDNTNVTTKESTLKTTNTAKKSKDAKDQHITSNSESEGERKGKGKRKPHKWSRVIPKELIREIGCDRKKSRKSKNSGASSRENRSEGEVVQSPKKKMRKSKVKRSSESGPGGESEGSRSRNDSEFKVPASHASKQHGSGQELGGEKALVPELSLSVAGAASTPLLAIPPGSAVTKSILKNSNSKTQSSSDPKKKRVSIVPNKYPSSGSEADDESAHTVVQPSRKRLSSVSFAPTPSFRIAPEDITQPEKASHLPSLSFVSYNSGFISEDNSFTPGGSVLSVSSSSGSSGGDSHSDGTLNTSNEITISTAKRKQLEDAGEELAVRRSKRTKVQPLKYWKNEKIKYERRQSGWSIKEVETVPTPKVVKRKFCASTKNKKKAAKGSVNDDVFGESSQDVFGVPDDMNEEMNPTVPVINPETKEEVFIDLFHTPEMLNFVNPSRCLATSSDPLIVDKYMSHNVFGSGQLILRPAAEKRKQHVRDDTMVFFVMKGVIEVTIHTTAAMLPAGSTFFIPQGNSYSIKNMQQTDARLFFVQVKG